MTPFPLSYMQESLWVLHQLDPASSAYNEATLLRFAGPLDPVALEKALNAVVERHAILRTIYRTEEEGPRQEALPFAPLALAVQDFPSPSAEENERMALRCAHEICSAPFDLGNGPMVRWRLLRLGGQEHLLVIAVHHLAFDAWSQQILLGELAAAYNACLKGAEPALPTPANPYAEFVSWQRDWLQGEHLEGLLDHWQKEMAGDLPALDLPLDHPRPAKPAYRAARYFFEPGPELVAEIRALGRRERVSAFAVMAAAYALLLSRYSGQDEVILGCPFANRMKLESRSRWDDTLGMFVNTLPLRMSLQGEALTVQQLLRRTRDTVLDAFTHQALPFELLVSNLQVERVPGRNPVFQTMINLRNVPTSDRTFEGLQVEKIPEPGPGANFDLSLEIDEEEGALRCALRYDVALFEPETIARMAGHLENLLRGMVEKPEAEVSALEILSPAEREEILFGWNRTTADSPPAPLHQMAESAAQADPHATAVIFAGESLTRGELLSRANRLANHLRARSVGEGAIVALALPRSADLLVAQLAVLKTGAAYLALDLNYPPERIQLMLEDAHPVALITLRRLATDLPPGLPLILLDEEAASIAAMSAASPSAHNLDALAYLTYTSGSTGGPKGVLTDHRGAANYILDMIATRRLKPGERVLQFTSFSFDASVRDTLGTLAFGGTVILLGDEQARDPVALLRAIRLQGANAILAIVPTMLRALADAALEAGTMNDTLRLIMVSGEVLTTSDVEKVRRAFGEGVEIVNQYGPTECSMIATTYAVPEKIPEGQSSLPIGKPISNVRAYVLDRNLRPLPPGAKGELFISGVGVGGYLNQPELAAANFLPDPFFAGSRMYRTGDLASTTPDGTLLFWGRRDLQVKVRGNRVELGEIEAVLKRHPLVKDAVALLTGDLPEKAILVAYIIPVSGREVPRDLREFAARWLPSYMLPAAWVAIESLPLTTTGKLDRRRLPAPENPGTGLIPARTEVEKRLVRIWTEVLKTDQIGVTSNFFELGGHSLLAMRLFARIEQEFGRALPLPVLFQDGTIEALARLLDAEGGRNGAGVVAIQPLGTKIPIFLIPAHLYLRELALCFGPERPVYGLQPAMGASESAALSIREEALLHYKSILEFHPDGPYLLAGHSYGGYVVLEVARLLRQDRRQVGFVGLLDTYAPGPRKQPGILERAQIHAENLRGQSPAQLVDYFSQSARRVLVRSMRFLPGNRGFARMLARAGEPRMVRRLAVQNYVPEPFNGDVTLFVVRERPWYMRWDPTEGWRGYIKGQVSIIQVPGDHMSMIERPRAAWLVHKIEELLP